MSPVRIYTSYLHTCAVYRKCAFLDWINTRLITSSTTQEAKRNALKDLLKRSSNEDSNYTYNIIMQIQLPRAVISFYNNHYLRKQLSHVLDGTNMAYNGEVNMVSTPNLLHRKSKCVFDSLLKYYQPNRINNK